MDASLTSRFLESVRAEYNLDLFTTQAGTTLFDYVNCAYAGHTLVADWFDAPAGDATVWGLSSGVASEQAAALNAAAGRVLDRDDLHWPSLTHPGSIIWPVVLALGEEGDVPFPVASQAAAIGYEVTVRLAVALGPSLRSHWHPTTTAGTVGAAVAAALVLAPEEPDVASSAAGHAASVCAGMIQVIIEHSPTSVFNSAHAARTGVVAARAAAGGMQGMQHGLEGPRGLFAAVAPEANPEDLMMPRPHWALSEATFRPYATTGYAQTAVEAALRMLPVDVSDIESIEIVTPPSAAGIAASTSPQTPLERWWSIPYAVAVTLAAGGADGLEEPSWAGHDQVNRLLAKTSVLATPNAKPDDLTTEIAIAFAGVSTAEAASVHLGHPEQPLDDDGLAAKWAALHPRVEPDQAQRVLAVCRDASSGTTREVVAAINQAVASPTG